jgi:hypothetical protein
VVCSCLSKERQKEERQKGQARWIIGEFHKTSTNKGSRPLFIASHCAAHAGTADSGPLAQPRKAAALSHLGVFWARAIRRQTSQTVGYGTTVAATTQQFYNGAGNLMKVIDSHRGLERDAQESAAGQKRSFGVRWPLTANPPVRPESWHPWPAPVAPGPLALDFSLGRKPNHFMRMG